MKNRARIEAELAIRIPQIACIKEKVEQITRYSEVAEIRQFAAQLEEVLKRYESFLTLPIGRSVARRKALTDSVLFNWRLDTFVYEVRYERLAVRYDNRFLDFFNTDPFLLFGLPEHIVYGKGIHNGVQHAEYIALCTSLRRDPELILAERERVTAYLTKGCDNRLFKKHGSGIPIDITVPSGY